jgi:hypothetical protein
MNKRSETQLAHVRTGPAPPTKLKTRGVVKDPVGLVEPWQLGFLSVQIWARATRPKMGCQVKRKGVVKCVVSWLLEF